VLKKQRQEINEEPLRISPGRASSTDRKARIKTRLGFSQSRVIRWIREINLLEQFKELTSFDHRHF
jgi:hypothetical protein